MINKTIKWLSPPLTEQWGYKMLYADQKSFVPPKYSYLLFIYSELISQPSNYTVHDNPKS